MSEEHVEETAPVADEPPTVEGNVVAPTKERQDGTSPDAMIR